MAKITEMEIADETLSAELDLMLAAAQHLDRAGYPERKRILEYLMDRHLELTRGEYDACLGLCGIARRLHRA